MTKDRWEEIKLAILSRILGEDAEADVMITAIVAEVEAELFTSMSVIQDWIHQMPLRMQSVLVMATRGPDTHRAPGIKQLTRWIRSLVFVPGNPNNVVEFMLIELPERLPEKGSIHRELEFTTQHYYSHLMHGLQVIGYRHPDDQIREHAFLLYQDMCSLFHLPVETLLMFEHRLRQMSWPTGVQPRDAKEAFELVASTNNLSARDMVILESKKKSV